MNHRFATPSRRRLLGLGAASLAALTPLARAQTGQPLKIMVGFAAGGSADQTARLLAEQRVAIEREVDWPGGGFSLYFRDPAGNSLELATPRLWFHDE